MTTTHKILLGSAFTIVIGAVLCDLHIWITGITVMTVGFLGLLAGPIAAEM